MVKSRFFWGIGVIALLALAGLLSACNSEPVQKIAVVSNIRVSAESELGKKLVEYSQAYIANLEAQMAVIRERNKGTDENSRRVLQQADNEFQVRLRGLQQASAAAFMENYRKALEDYRRNNKVDLILPLESVASHNTNMDATNDIIKIMNTYPLPKEFEIPAAQPAPQAAPAKPAAPAQPAPAAAPATQEDKPAR